MGTRKASNVTDGLEELEERLGHSFSDPSLLERALSHRSWCAEHGGPPNNERLEFLGDAVLGWVIADLAFRRYEAMPEGRLTDLRKDVVNAAALAEVARSLEIGPHIRLGRGEAAAGGADKPSILSDAFEAILGAVYLDGGPASAYGLVDRHVSRRFDMGDGRPLFVDHKTRLQEVCAARRLEPPQYLVTGAGPDHARVFTARVLIGDDLMGDGSGRSKKAAQQKAAEEALARLETPGDAPSADDA